MSTRNGHAGPLHGEKVVDSSSSSAAGALYVPWQTLSALANETGQAVRQTFTDASVSTSGHVQESVRHHAAPNGHTEDFLAESEILLDSGQIDPAEWHAKDSAAFSQVDPEAVQADIRKVERKMLSTDAATEVILRFNFMSGLESRVREAYSVVYNNSSSHESQAAFVAGFIAVSGSLNYCRCWRPHNRVHQ